MTNFRVARRAVVVAVGVQSILASGVAAQPAQPGAPANWEVEADPLAFGLNGYSAHVGYRWDSLRADIGAFAADVPESFHGNDGWKSRAKGLGVKLDYVGSENGAFVGVEANYQRTQYSLTSAGQSVARDGVAAGARAGYRFTVGSSRLYVAPWVGVDYAFGKIGAAIAGRTFDEKRVQLFPTIHVGWRF